MKKHIIALEVLLGFLLSCSQDNNLKTEQLHPAKATASDSSSKNEPAFSSEPIPTKKDSISSTPPSPSYPDISPTVTIKTLWCNEKTEGTLGMNKQDEVYFILAGKKTGGETYEARLPAGLTWSLEKSGGSGKQSLEGKYGAFSAWHGTLKSGESVELTFFWMEEDAGKAGDRIKAAARAAKATDPNDAIIGTAATVGVILGALIERDNDDSLGSFAVKITNENGTLKKEWQVKDNCLDKGEDPNGKRFDLSGSGAYYMTTVEVK
jgi:hypothetical protein